MYLCGHSVVCICVYIKYVIQVCIRMIYMHTYIRMCVHVYARVCNIIHTYVRMYRPWNLSIEDTIRAQLTVLHREVSLIQRYICTQLYVGGTADTVLIREVSLVWSVLNGEVPLYVHNCLMLSIILCTYVRMYTVH